MFIGRTNVEAETPIVWPHDAKSWHLKRPRCWERLRAEGEGDDRGWDGWMASPTWWTWVWVRTEKPGMLQSTGWQRVRHDWATEMNWIELKELIDTQLKLKHIEESCSPWNYPIFVIKKKFNKQHLLTDLRKVNASMKPTTIPQNWHIIIIDLQDCFITIPLHTLDWERFAFSFPFPNHIGPHKRFQ